MKPDHPAVDIVLATYQGEAFLAPQLASIAAQTGVAWRLFVRDDGSTDATRSIVAGFRERHPGRVTLVEDEDTRLGAARSFSRLLAATTAPYVFMCDQDDVWWPDKLERSLARLRRAEAEAGVGRPVLVHTDLRVVDTELRLLAPSMDAYQRLGAARRSALRQLLVQNTVTGCTAGVNRALLDRALPVPEDAIMHDWWMALVAAAFGRVVYVPEATIDYRQHGANALGARRYGFAMRKTRAEFRRSLERTFAQAGALMERHGPAAPAAVARTIQRYAALADCGSWRRRWRVARYGYWKHGIGRNLAMLLVL
jgi:glycosyltransferase involved in cell wall biosynthesis